MKSSCSFETVVGRNICKYRWCKSGHSKRQNSRSKDEGEVGRMVQTKKWLELSVWLWSQIQERCYVIRVFRNYGVCERCTWVRLSFRLSLHLACFSSSSFDSMKGSKKILQVYFYRHIYCGFSFCLDLFSSIRQDFAPPNVSFFLSLGGQERGKKRNKLKKKLAPYIYY